MIRRILPNGLKGPSGFFKKALLVYVILAIVPTVLVTAAATLIFTNGRSEQNLRMVDRYMRQTETIILERMELYEDVFYRLIADLDFIRCTKILNSEEDEAYAEAYRTAGNMIRNYTYTYSDIRGAAFVPDKGRVVNVSRWYNGAGAMIWSDPAVQEEIRSGVTDLSKLTFMAVKNLNRYDQENPDYVIFMAMPVRDLVTKERTGALIFALSSRIFLFDNLPPVDVGLSSVVTDADDRILAGTENAFIGGSLAEYLKTAYAGKRISTAEYIIGDTDWKIISLIDNGELSRPTRRFILLVALLMLAISATFFFAVFRFLRGYLGEISKIASGIERYDAEESGTLDIEMDRDDELMLIVNRFNAMTGRVNELVQTLKDRNEEIRIAENDRRHAEIKALEAQINPHFLYNTLDSINWRAIDNGEEEISNMLGMLGSLLRYSISNIDILVLLRAEIEWIRKYVALQQDRFNNSFTCVYDVTDEAMDFPIYKMLLQPIIENSILHAFENTTSGGLIRVSGRVLPDERLEISIEDNGCGMKEDVLAMIRQETSGRKGLNSRSIGISNVAMRLRIYYQNEADFEVDSKEGVGTKVTIRVPAQHDVYV